LPPPRCVKLAAERIEICGLDSELYFKLASETEVFLYISHSFVIRPKWRYYAIATHSHIGTMGLLIPLHLRGPMSHSPSAATRMTVAALAAPPRVERLGPVAGRFLHALRLIAVHEKIGRDPVPELAARLGNVEVAAKALILAQAIAATWPENIAISRFCCRLMSHDEATIGAFVDAAASGDRRSFEMALDGLIRPERTHRLWEAALALAHAELRAV
jgi:hypothetical protein